MSSDPFISNDNFIFYSDISLIQQFSNSVLDSIFRQFIKYLHPEHIVVFVATEYLELYLPYLLTVQHKFVLITTSNDDPCVPYYYFPCRNPVIQQAHDALLDHPYLLRWFTKNPSICHPKLIPIPLGPKWQYTNHAFFGEPKEPILKVLRTYCLTPLENFQGVNNECIKDKLLYFHFGQTTEDPFYSPHKGIRQEVLEICQKGFPLSDGADFENYLISLRQHRFALSPPGRGMDTHRTWEALMVGTIPIVLHSPLDILYDKLPVLIVDDWSVITPEFLEERYVEFQKGVYDFSRLYAHYWKEKIRENI
jgi:hypothetical protein